MSSIQRDFKPVHSAMRKLCVTSLKRLGILMILAVFVFLSSGCAGVSRNGGTPAGQGKAWWESDSPDYNRKYSW
jgi:hypothetical protein